ncbi:DUF3291 domain-containing protein [Planomonospora sp. ID91781]|uniref:DUF3291 domain-containing protein n=1 Tax=Planomonospora sphaerica TaxID=161355 RepID=A0A171DIG1_9ACTN|nr:MULTISPECIES: DUF3291 domain-containing protein [Planomonospora]MBG0823741.1 DUF3291 domain-containing protein [Planomonospora sp. ID91781]GAT68692.1 hypothetical protein PS9374_04357 [Planomonospora sphaerica]
MHLAQLNVARLRAPLDSPEIADFVALLEPVNKISDESPGFVWRLKESEDDPQATVQHDYGDDLVINFSVWESREALWNFVYRSAHLPVLQRRREWFLSMAEPYSVMWWIPEGHIPSLAEGMERLELLRREGPGPRAFTFRDFHDGGAAGDGEGPGGAGSYGSSEAASLPAAAEARK